MNLFQSLSNQTNNFRNTKFDNALKELIECIEWHAKGGNTKVIFGDWASARGLTKIDAQRICDYLRNEGLEVEEFEEPYGEGESKRMRDMLRIEWSKGVAKEQCPQCGKWHDTEHQSFNGESK